MSKVLLQHDSCRPHTRLKTRQVIISFKWTTLTHPLTDQIWHHAISFFFDTKNAIRGQQFTTDEQVKHAVKKSLKLQPTEFYKAGIHTFIHQWTISIEKVAFKFPITKLYLDVCCIYIPINRARRKLDSLLFYCPLYKIKEKKVKNLFLVSRFDINSFAPA